MEPDQTNQLWDTLPDLRETKGPREVASMERTYVRREANYYQRINVRLNYRSWFLLRCETIAAVVS